MSASCRSVPTCVAYAFALPRAVVLAATRTRSYVHLRKPTQVWRSGGLKAVIIIRLPLHKLGWRSRPGRVLVSGLLGCRRLVEPWRNWHDRGYSTTETRVCASEARHKRTVGDQC